MQARPLYNPKTFPPSQPRSMSSLPVAPGVTRRRFALPSFRLPRRVDAATLARKLANFWLVWIALLIVHEGGHALVARHEGLSVQRVTVGVGPVLWRGQSSDAELVIRLVPVLGLTTLDEPAALHPTAPRESVPPRFTTWVRELATIGGGLAATLALAIAVAGIVALRERVADRRWIWGRMLIADALVLTVFNLLPVPPLDGGRAALEGLVAWRGAPFASSTLFWVHAGGLALAVVPLALWTRWTARLDAFVMRWKAPPDR